MSINGINGSYYSHKSGIDVQKATSPFSMLFNQVFDEFVFSQDLLNTKDALETNKADNKVKVIAHRGYSEVAPENTIAAFIAAAENGYDTIECDIEWTKDGVPVILHDETINRTARRQNGWRLFIPRKCSNLTYDKLLEYDFGSWFSKDFKGTKIPKFDEVLDCANEYDLNLYIELKETTDFDEEKAKLLTDSVKDAGLSDRVTWISFNSDYLKTMSEVCPNARLGYLTKKEVSENTIDTLNDLKTGENEVFLDIKASKITEKSSAALKDAGFDFEVWTVDDTEKLEDLAEYDCKGITTNKITEDDIADYYNP